MKYYYFVSFKAENLSGGIRYSNAEIFYDRRITTIQDTVNIQNRISGFDYDFHKVVIDNYILLRIEGRM